MFSRPLNFLVHFPLLLLLFVSFPSESAFAAPRGAIFDDVSQLWCGWVHALIPLCQLFFSSPLFSSSFFLWPLAARPAFLCSWCETAWSQEIGGEEKRRATSRSTTSSVLIVGTRLSTLSHPTPQRKKKLAEKLRDRKKKTRAHIHHLSHTHKKLTQSSSISFRGNLKR